MKRRLDDRVLQKADIILTTGSGSISGTIRFMTGTDISHAMLYVEHCSIIDATGDGVHSENTQRKFFDPKHAIHVLRLPEPITDYVATSICNYVRERVGTEYTKWEAARALKGTGVASSPKQFCSRLVAQAYARAGFNIVESPDFCTPGDLLKSKALVEVPDAIVEVTDEEVEAWNNHPDTTKIGRYTLNAVLAAARNINPAIQNLSDVDYLILHNKVHDEAVNEIYHKSGFLDVWKFECEKNPWHYQEALMKYQGSIQPEDVAWHCKKTLGGEGRDDNRFTKNLQVYRYYQPLRPRKTFETLILLYSVLAWLHQRRWDVAEDWLKNNPGY